MRECARRSMQRNFPMPFSHAFVLLRLVSPFSFREGEALYFSMEILRTFFEVSRDPGAALLRPSIAQLFTYLTLLSRYLQRLTSFLITFIIFFVLSNDARSGTFRIDSRVAAHTYPGATSRRPRPLPPSSSREHFV